MNQRRLPDWLSMFLGLWSRTPRGLAARYAASADRSGVLKPVFRGEESPSPGGGYQAVSQDTTPAMVSSASAGADSDALRAA